MQNDHNSETESHNINQQKTSKSKLLIPATIMIGMIILIGWRLISYGNLHGEVKGISQEQSTADFESTQDNANNEITSGEAKIYIQIEQPQDGAVLDPSVTVSGKAAGMFEGNVVVQVLSLEGNVLAEKATTIDSPDAGIGGEGPWAVQLEVDVETDTSGFIYAFSPSPVDGSHAASAKVQVLFKAGDR